MKIKFIGTSFGAPSPGRHQQSILLETPSGNSYLFDTGAPVVDVLVNENYDLRKIKAVFISHMHGDHINGIFDLMYLSQYFGMNYEIFSPDANGTEFLKSYLKLQHIENTGFVSFECITELKFFDNGDITVSAVKTNHMIENEGGSYGFVVESCGKKIYISGDLHSSLNDFPDFAKDEIIDIAIVECAHFDAKVLIDKLSEYRINKAAVIHVMPTEKYEYLKAVADSSDNKIILPSDGECIEI